MRRRIVEKDAMSLLAVFSESFAMIAYHDDQRRVDTGSRA